MPRFDKDPQYRRAENSAKRADWFATFNREAMIRDAWIISSPGSQTVTIECLPGNPWVQELKERGFPITWIEDGQRNLPHEVREEMTINADGTHGVLTPGSTQATTTVVPHAGIAKTTRFSFPSPW
jgi:hypothetical protein